MNINRAVMNDHAIAECEKHSSKTNESWEDYIAALRDVCRKRFEKLHTTYVWSESDTYGFDGDLHYPRQFGTYIINYDGTVDLYLGKDDEAKGPWDATEDIMKDVVML